MKVKFPSIILNKMLLATKKNKEMTQTPNEPPPYPPRCKHNKRTKQTSPTPFRTDTSKSQVGAEHYGRCKANRKPLANLRCDFTTKPDITFQLKKEVGEFNIEI